MGRYASIQAYADNNANMRKVPYEQAAGASASNDGGQPKAAVKPEKVVNPYGSTAGAGSGEFHVYRHARAREMERLQQLDETTRQELLDKEYSNTLQQYKEEAESKTAKNRKKRKRQKEAKLRKKNLKLAGVLDSNDGGGDTATGNDKDILEGEEEFTYVPMNQQAENGGKEDERDKKEDAGVTTDSAATDKPKIPFANDGSFLEQMKKRLEQEKESKREENCGEDDDEDDGPQPEKKQDR